MKRAPATGNAIPVHGLAVSLLFILAALLSACVRPFEAATPSPAPSKTPAPTVTPSPTTTSTPTKTPTPLPGDMSQTYIISMDDNGRNHLFAYAPTKSAPIRLTNGLWDDIDPAISGDGNKVVFASNRNAYWDLYVLNLADGQTTRITDTPGFDGSPAWSPDSQWITYESMLDGQTHSIMQINIYSVANPGQNIQLTSGAFFNQEPVWSPLGRQLAFVSNRSGDDEIWLANLDQPEENRYTNISQSPNSAESHPAWSPDGKKLAWTQHIEGQPDAIYIWDSSTADQLPRRAGSGDWPTWSASGNEIASRLSGPNEQYMLAYTLDGAMTLPPVPVQNMRGLSGHLERISKLANIFAKPAQLSPTPLWQRQARAIENIPGQRESIVKLDDVNAPHPFLHQAVADSFNALRQRLIEDTGWDVLASLENAYTPLTTTLDPGGGQDWLFTGRAFAINPLTLNAGWMVVTREELEGRLYWRIFLKTVAQDGSQGEPMRVIPWDLTARYGLNPTAYDQGGAYASSIPDGFWVDLTATALRFGWERIPAQDNWRSYFKGSLFNEFILNSGIDWRTAMLKLYPPDIFITPTVIITPTATLSATPKGYYYKTATPTLTSTPTMRPTYTPAP